jgi:hypothetical protein
MDRPISRATPNPQTRPFVTRPSGLLPGQRTHEFSGFLGKHRAFPDDPFRASSGQQADCGVRLANLPDAPAGLAQTERLGKRRDTENDPERQAPASSDYGQYPDASGSELDATSRALAALRPPECAPTPAPAAGINPALLEQAAHSMLRNISWGRAGDRTVVQLRLANGRFADAEITLESNRDRCVAVRIFGTDDAELAALESTLRTRFEARGLAIDLTRSAR